MLKAIFSWLASLFVSKAPFKELRRGMMNDPEVAEAQAKLKRLKFYLGTDDDDFGPVMEAATVAAQKAAGLITKDGVIREELMIWIDAQLALLPPPPAGPVGYVPLSWEADSSARKEWSQYILTFLEENFSVFSKAKDWPFFRKDWSKLTRAQQINVMAEFVASVAYYESRWNPKSASVDVGTQGNKDTWSVGLMQMSVTDQKNRGYKYGYRYEDLEKPIPNLHLALSVLKDQISKYGLVRLKAGRSLYWAVIGEGNKYDKSVLIATRINALNLAASTASATPITVAGATAPWMKVVAGEMGQNEISGAEDNPRIVAYHKTTTLKASDDETPWCSSFVNWVFAQLGLKRTNSAAAKSWLEWGIKLRAPQFGCVVVMPRTGGNHVTFWLRAEQRNGVAGFIGRGGNQSNTVKDSWYANSTVSGYRWPSESAAGAKSV